MVSPTFTIDNEFSVLDPHRAALNRENELVDLKLSMKARMGRTFHDLTEGQKALAQSIIDDCASKLEALRNTEQWKAADAAKRDFEANNPVSVFLKSTAGMNGAQVMIHATKLSA